ncbi:heparan-alpha-glucosaminide N-acetyltransferase [Tabrizicola sp.]|uniref:heparan-alpha-glucosaminide N-acetyltransferase n=1 Tax=Tabrizicola sp. TaxID=2005166 RepID=UPI002FDEBBB4
MTEAPLPAGRLTSLDIARTLALVCMVVFHFTFDLALFRHIDPGTMSQPFWYYFARSIAGSFLFLSGIGLWLAHGRGIRWPAFWKRWAMIAAAAALITTASIWLVPGGPIWFGILHAIAVTALLCLVFLRLPWPLTLAVAALIFAAGWGPRFAAFDPLWLVWTGLAETRPMMGDYVPLIPWAAPALAGLAIAKALRMDQWRGSPPSPLIRALTFPGRHTLIIYLVHQPLFFGLFSAWAWATS